MTRRLTAAVTQDGQLYVAQCLEVDVASQGTSEHDALANLREALELLFEDPAGVVVGPTPVIASIDLGG
jgi:predicted RNase H-like HicB family nuclease